MRYDQPYRFLREDQKAVLRAAGRQVEREIFCDCLAALHDLAAGAGSAPAFSFFTLAQAEALFRRASQWQSPELAGLRQNLEINWQTVNELRACGAEMNVRGYADEFVDCVIRQYRILSMAEPAAIATSSRFSS